MMKTMTWMVVVGVVGISCVAAWAQEVNPPESAFETRMREEKMQTGSRWYILPYRPTYVLPLSYSSSPSLGSHPDAESSSEDLQNAEIKFQLSMRLPVADELIFGNGELNFAYTQVCIWQAYNFENSAPFRDTNYEPEMFLVFDTDYELFGLRGRQITLGAVHQSNGRGDEILSRSWNRLYANIVLDRGNFACSLKPWWRIPEDEETDNNPNIEEYLGYGEIRAAYKIKEHVLSAMLRNNLRSSGNRGAVELDWSFPLGRVRGYVQYFNGYAETLLTYDESDERIGIGILLADVL